MPSVCSAHGIGQGIAAYACQPAPPEWHHFILRIGVPARERNHAPRRRSSAPGCRRTPTRPTNTSPLRGTFLVGFGEDFSQHGLVAHPADGFVTAGANMPHFASARGVTEVQVHAIGPFQLTYVHPEDDPTKTK